MHAIFFMYGLHNLVEEAKWEMTTTKLPIKLWQVDENGGKVDKGQTIIQCQFRSLPGGLCEFIFPREFKDTVLKGLKFDKPDSGHGGIDPTIFEYSFMGLKPFDLVKKALRIEPVPEIADKNEKGEDIGAYPFLFLKNVSIIPLGVRYDSDIEEPNGRIWHEAI